MSQNKAAAFDRQLEENGYKLSTNGEDSMTYKKEDGRTITKTKWGLVKYHVPLSKEEVTELVAKHEGMPVDSYGSVDDFTKAVESITTADLGKAR